MAAAIGIPVLGGLLIASGLKGVGITDLIAGAVGGVLNPAGGKREFPGSVLDTGAGMVGGQSVVPGAGSGGTISGSLSSANGLVDSLVSIAQRAGGPGVYVVSASRPGATTTSGNVSDHADNSAARAARDIAVKGVNAITGPPMPELDKAVVAIGNALGRSYKPGVRIVDTFTKNGLRVQVIWRTPEYGGHMGHIHVGAHKV